jgi:class 3 adenylate cyclase
MQLKAAKVVSACRVGRASDEAGTLSRLQAHRRELIEPKIAEHGGRVIKTTGDGMLIEFPSVVGALRCAVDIQSGMADRNVDVPAEKRIEFRVGINLEDVIVEDGDLFGEGVNVAARLEALAQPAGFASQGQCASTSATSFLLRLSISESKQSKILPDPCESIASMSPQRTPPLESFLAKKG